MDKHAEVGLLLDIYGELLTEKQRDIMEQYYSYDLSLQEIADNEGISRQGVHDLVKRSEHTLYRTEEKLGFRNRLQSIISGLDSIDAIMEELSRSDDKTAALLIKCKEEIDRLKNSCMGG